MKYFKVELRVSERDLGTVLGTVIGTVDLLGVSPLEDGEPETKRTVRYVDGIKSKGIRGTDLIIEELQKGPRTRQQLVGAFTGRGFAGASVNAALSRCRDERTVRYNAVIGAFELTGA